MTTKEAVAVLKDAVETAGVHPATLELYCANGNDVLEAIRVVLLDVDSNMVIRDRYSTEEG